MRRQGSHAPGKSSPWMPSKQSAGAAGGFLETVGVVPGAVSGAALGGAVFWPFPRCCDRWGSRWCLRLVGRQQSQGGFGLRSPEEMSPELHPMRSGASPSAGPWALGVPYGAVATGFPPAPRRSGNCSTGSSSPRGGAPVRFGLTEVDGTQRRQCRSAAEGLFPGNVGADGRRTRRWRGQPGETGSRCRRVHMELRPATPCNRCPLGRTTASANCWPTSPPRPARIWT